MNMQRANHRTVDLERIAREHDATELALAAIWAVLNVDGIAGWNDWNRYAATGEWN